MSSVALIDYTGAGSSDSMYAARLLLYTKNTRLGQGPEQRKKFAEMDEQAIIDELDYVAKTIRSSWEFVDYTFEIQGVTRAFTHQLVRTRTASYAQEAQRVVNKTDFANLKPDTVIAVDNGDHWDELMKHISDCYAWYQAHGVPNQDCRGVLPTNVLTNIITKMNLRTLADIVGKRENLRAQGEYADVVRGMKREVLAVHPWVAPFLNPERTKTPELDEILRLALGDNSPIDKPRVNAALKELDALKGTWG